ncbi:MAG TPA: hypothetical protein VFS75_00650 [Candidatus Paceibacterota bacterium]|nr:hypothetical protein [Candidatus Paceibacterota bacterium]
MNASTTLRIASPIVIMSLLLALLPVATVRADDGTTTPPVEAGLANDTVPLTEAVVSSDPEPSDDAVTVATSSAPSGDATSTETVSADAAAMESGTSTSALSSSTTPVAHLTATTSASSTTWSSTGTSSATSTEWNGLGSTTVDTDNGGAGTTTVIKTGTAVALANVLNLVNSNFVNSKGVVLFKNFFDTLTGGLDLRDYLAASSSTCSLSGCADNEVHTNIENGAILDNSLYVTAETGGNTIDGAENAAIASGDAYAGVNLVNVANTNVIDSNYLLVTMNAFQDVNGDIVFPSLEKFFGELSQSTTPAALSITNEGSIDNDISLDTATGANMADASSSTISSGASASGVNVFNQLNTSLVGGKSVSIIFRVNGSWAGQVFGAPDTLAWMDNGDGGIYLFDTEGGTGGGGSLYATTTNAASIKNRVHVVALTGENEIHNADTALISTGNAYAGANIMNVANATVVGRNWILAIVNILGDFNGNIAFGRPDLWVGGQATVPTGFGNGDTAAYKVTVINNGDSTATDVTLRATYDADHLALSNASVPLSLDGRDAVWHLGDIPAGGAVELTYSGTVKNAGEGTDIDTTYDVMEHETDNNMVDNSDIVTVSTAVHHHGSNSHGKKPEPTTLAGGSVTVPRALVVERESATTSVRLDVAATTTERLTLTNDGDEAVDGVVLHDVLRDPEGAVLHEEVWDLGTVAAHETVRIGYDIGFDVDAPVGVYRLETVLDAAGMTRTYGMNGSILVWSSPAHIPAVPLVPAPMTTPSTTEPSVATTTDAASIIDAFLPNIAEAASDHPENPEVAYIRNLKRELALAGALLVISGSILLMYRYRRDWLDAIRNKIRTAMF